MHSILTASATVLLLALPAQLMSQAGPPPSGQAWAVLPVPQGVVASALAGQGKLVTYREGTTVYVYSAVTRCWHQTDASTSVTMQLFNDCLVLLEAGYCRAFASYTGEFVDVTVGAGAMLLNGGSNKNDSIALVFDNGMVHAFSAFTGAWATRAVSSSYGASVQRHVALLSDGNTMAAMGAFAGQWHDLQAPAPITSLSADGAVGVATAGDTAYAFSANTDGWRSHRVPNGATFTRGDDWALWYGSGRAIAFSGLRGKFTGLSADVSALWGSTDLFALLATPHGLIAWSAITATFTAPQRDPLLVEVEGATALLHDAIGVRGYSALRQAFAGLPELAASSGVGTDVAYLVAAGSGQIYAWSSKTASFHAAPAGAYTNPPALTTTTVGLTTGTETYAFSTNDGSFVPLGGPVLGTASNPTSAPLLAYDNTAFYSFDTRIDRWLSTPRTSQAQPLFRVWRTSSVVLDDTAAHGIGAQAGRWYRQDLPMTTSSVLANSEVGYVATTDRIAACSMVPGVVPFAQFPHFRRVQPLGAPVRHMVLVPPGAIVLAAFGQVSTPTLLPGLGLLWLDPQNIVAAPITAASNQLTVELRFELPTDPLLIGLTIGNQALVLPVGSQPYLTEPGTVTIW